MGHLSTILVAAALAFLPGGGLAQDGTGAVSLNGAAGPEAPAERGEPPAVDCPADWEVCPGHEPAQYVIVTGSRIAAAAPSITNNQEAGVDEGDIVKMWGDILIILRRGRLFTVSTAGDDLRPVDWIDAVPPHASPGDYTWFDEMLVADGWISVIGYSYAGDGTDIIRFRVSQDGRLTYADSHRLSGHDYYSSRNYASRLLGAELIVYSPSYAERGADPMASLPTLTRLDGRRAERPRPLVQPRDIHIAAAFDETDLDTIHTIIRCDLTARVFGCTATAILGPEGRSFYVSREAAYLWLTAWRSPRQDRATLPDSTLFQVPLGGGQPRGVAVRGAPIDQFSFLEDAASGHLHVLVAGEARGDAMWEPELADGELALLSLPLHRFRDGAVAAEDGDYRALPHRPRNGDELYNQFVGGHLLYADTAWGWREEVPGPSLVSIVPLTGGEVTSLLLAGQVERIEAMGRDALVVTRTPDVAFHTVALVPDQPDQRWPEPPGIVDTFVMPATRGAETRSHAFFYQPDLDSPDGEFGTLALPVLRTPEDEAGWNDWTELTADMAFLRRGHDRVRLLGTLDSRPELRRDDRCVTSCYGWYGDARPIFVRSRAFALLGYELVEGRPEGRTMREVRRVSFDSVLPIH